jgi:hypothetical protein
VRSWFSLLLLAPALAWPAEDIKEGAPPTPADEPPVNWVDTSHAYATNQAQALTKWMDQFFGDPEYNVEQAESWLRIETDFEWDQDDGTDSGIRLGGQVQLPRISRRLALVFSGSQDEDLDPEERDLEDRVGLQYKISDEGRSRFDVTLGLAGGHLRPGVRYRNEGDIGDDASYRFTQRIQHEPDEGFFSTSQLDLNRALDNDSVLRWTNRGVWGEDTLGVEWRSKLSLRHRLFEDTPRPVAISYYGTVNGVTRPEQWIRNYKLGVLLRRKIYRDFLFFEVEPALNYRRRQYEDDRNLALSVVVRFEIALEKDLRRVRDDDHEMQRVSPGPED